MDIWDSDPNNLHLSDRIQAMGWTVTTVRLDLFRGLEYAMFPKDSSHCGLPIGSIRKNHPKMP